MAVPSWPNGLPYASQRDGFQVTKLDTDPVRTEMNAGTTRERQRTSLVIGAQQVAIKFKITEIDAFHAFWRDTLNRGVSRFTMPVWVGSSYQTRTVKIVAPITEQISGANDTLVTMTLQVEGLV